MDKHYAVEQFVEEFTEFKSVLVEHIEFNNEFVAGYLRLATL